MELTINGVNVKITAEEVLNALMSEEGKGLRKLKKELDMLEAEITEVEFEEEPISDEEIERIFGSQLSNDVIQSVIEDSPSSDTEVPLPQKKDEFIDHRTSGYTKLPLTPFIITGTIEKKPKKKYHRKHKHNKKRIKPARKYSVAPGEEKVAKFVGKTKPVKNEEDDPIIRPAIRPKSNNIEVNV